MQLNAPILLTFLRIALIPVLVLCFYLPTGWSNELAVVVFVVAAVTDWADGFLARRWNQLSDFGAFLDPVADKLMVAVALVLLVEQNPTPLFALAAATIIGREIVISALREWMAEMGERGRVKVSNVGKLKTIFQMVAIGMLLYRDPLWNIPVAFIGELLLYLAAALTLWSMWVYLASAWPIMAQSTRDRDSSTGLKAKPGSDADRHAGADVPAGAEAEAEAEPEPEPGAEPEAEPGAQPEVEPDTRASNTRPIRKPVKLAAVDSSAARNIDDEERLRD